MRNHLNVPTVFGSVAALAAALIFSPVGRALPEAGSVLAKSSPLPVNAVPATDA